MVRKWIGPVNCADFEALARALLQSKSFLLEEDDEEDTPPIEIKPAVAIKPAAEDEKEKDTCKE